MTNVFPAQPAFTDAPEPPPATDCRPLRSRETVRACEKSCALDQSSIVITRAGQPAHSEDARRFDLTSHPSLPDQDPEELAFRGFRLLPRARLLLCESRPVPLGSRAFDLLEVLLRHRGAVVSKEQIVRSVWPSTTVEESNLRFQMAALRKALGSDRDLIKTIPGRGYVLAAEAEVEPGSGRVLGFQTAPVAPPSGQAELAIGSIARPEYAFLRRIEDCERRRLETLSAALLCCLEELRQISGKAARRRVVTYARARPDLRAQHRSKRNRAHR